jgi:outer membrane protein, heavy metal efflux system
MSCRKRFLLFFLKFVLSCSLSFGQGIYKDTLKITIPEADSIFRAKNLQLLAEKFNVDATRALIVQNRLWDNPTISINQNVYNPETSTTGGRKWFNVSNNGETSVSVQQLFLLAGKRNKRIKLAELATQREEQNYFDMLRTLKYSLRSNFYNIFYLRQIIKVYDKETVSLSKLIKVYEAQLEKGYISKKEVLRLKSNLFSLETENLGFLTQLNGALADFNVLLHTSNVNYFPVMDDARSSYISPDSLQLGEMIDTAFVHRYDLKMAQTDVANSQMNLSYQKALAIPDVSILAGWDRNGSFVHDYNYVGLQFDLPFFNRNQGNVKSAKFALESNKYKLQSSEDQVKADVIQSYGTLLETDRLYNHFDTKFVNDLDVLIDEMAKNYEKRNISLIEFLDYYDAYKENAVQINNLQYNRINAFENLNFSVGKDITNK